MPLLPLHSPRPQAPNILYTLLPLSCGQCGLRMFDSRQGKRKMDQHLDWHFTYKRRIREGAGRTAGRGWFTNEEVRARAETLFSVRLPLAE